MKTDYRDYWKRSYLISPKNLENMRSRLINIRFEQPLGLTHEVKERAREQYRDMIKVEDVVIIEWMCHEFNTTEDHLLYLKDKCNLKFKEGIIEVTHYHNNRTKWVVYKGVTVLSFAYGDYGQVVIHKDWKERI